MLLPAARTKRGGLLGLGRFFRSSGASVPVSVLPAGILPGAPSEGLFSPGDLPAGDGKRLWDLLVVALSPPSKGLLLDGDEGVWRGCWPGPSRGLFWLRDCYEGIFSGHR